MLTIPEIRDYQRINAELKVLLDAGHPLIRLVGAEGQRLLVSGLTGDWDAVIEVDGRTGPEFASGIDGPNLVVVARGSTADGLALGIRSGRVLVLGDAGDAAGAGQLGGLIVIAGSAGHRAGLGQMGGTLALLGSVGRLAGDRQSGGRVFVRREAVGPHVGRGRLRGSWIELPAESPLDPEADRAWREVMTIVTPRLDPASLPPSPIR